MADKNSATGHTPEISADGDSPIESPLPHAAPAEHPSSSAEGLSANNLSTNSLSPNYLSPGLSPSTVEARTTARSLVNSPNVHRTRSIQFSPHDPRARERSSGMSVSVSPGQLSSSYGKRWNAGNGAADLTADSSADEITPIIDDRARRRHYSSTSQPQDYSQNYSKDFSKDQPRSSSSIAGQKSIDKHSIGQPHGDSDDEDEPEAEESDDAAEARGWLRRALDKYGSVELDNRGSVARDHLALERTFLAWLRTSLAFASIGIAVTQLFRLNSTISGDADTPSSGTLRLRQVGKPLGATFLAIAIVVLASGCRRYFESQYWIIRGKFPASRGSVALITLFATSLIVVSLVVVLVVDPSQLQSS